MAQVAGVVQEIQERPVAGGKTAYNVVVGGQGYGAGLYAPKAKVGDYVEFEVDEARGYKNVARGTLRVSANKGPAPATAAAQAAPAKPNTSVYDNRQDIISRQAAANTALQFLNLAVTTGALELPKSTSKKGAALDALDTLVHKYTEVFYERATGTEYKDISPDAKVEEEAEGPDVGEDTPVEDIPWT